MLNCVYSKRLDRALEYAGVALSLARASANRENLAFVLNDLCRLYTCRGEFEQAYPVIREARELWRALDNQVMLADSFGSEGEALFNAGEFEASLEVLRQALQITEQIDNLWGQSYDRMLMSFIDFESGRLGPGIRQAEQAVALGEQAGLLASNSLRCELAWVYAYCGAFDQAFPLVEKASQVFASGMTDWQAFPPAAKVRMHLLQGDLRAARETAGDAFIKPISIPYARYTIFVCLANIELAVAQGDFKTALALSEDFLNDVASQTRVDIPEALRWKAKALLGLGRLDEAHAVLTEACTQAVASGSNLHLWLIQADLAVVNTELGKQPDAKAQLNAARLIVRQIADSLQEVGLRATFLNQPRVQALIG